MLLLSLPIPGRDANGNPLPARPVTVPFTVPVTGTVTVTGPSTVTVRDTTGNTLGAPGLSVGFDGTAGATYIATVAGTTTGYLTAEVAAAHSRSIASLGGPGVTVEGGELYTVDSSGDSRNVLDDGNGNAVVDFLESRGSVQWAGGLPPGRPNSLYAGGGSIQIDSPGAVAGFLHISSNPTIGFAQFGQIGHQQCQVRTFPPAPTTGIDITPGTAWENTTGADVTLRVPVTYNPTSTAAAGLSVGVGPSSTPTTVEEENIPAGGLAGTVHTTVVYVPASFYCLLTTANSSLGTGIAYPV